MHEKTRVFENLWTGAEEEEVSEFVLKNISAMSDQENCMYDLQRHTVTTLRFYRRTCFQNEYEFFWN